jgi:hypothetical protein
MSPHPHFNWIANSLWDLVSTGRRKPIEKSTSRKVEKSKARQFETSPNRKVGSPRKALGLSTLRPLPATAKTSAVKKVTMQDRYDAIVIEMKHTYNVQVRKWRKNSSGLAWEIRYRNGQIKKFIAAPYPRGPMSCAIFLHEIGHHAIGLGVYRPRCLEEYHVWVWAIDMMKQRGFNVTPAVEKRIDRSLRYAVGKARRRGLRQIPPELQKYA